MTLCSREVDLSLLYAALRNAGFRGEVETDRALRAAMSTDNSVYQITPDFIAAPMDAGDAVLLMSVLAQPEFASFAVTARGGGTGTNGQSLNHGLIVDMRRHMNRLLEVNPAQAWADVEPGMVLDDLNEQLRPHGLFFAPETSTSSRCTIGGMVSTDASGKGSRIYGKTSDNILGLDMARPQGVLSSLAPTPEWAVPMLEKAEAAARAGRAAFVARTPRLNRRFTGYDLERACPPGGGFEWWRLLLGAEGTLGLITRIRVKLRRIEPEKRLLVVGFDSFHDALASATPLLGVDPTAVEVMDEAVQAIAHKAGILNKLPKALQAPEGKRLAYTFIEFNGDDDASISDRIAACRKLLRDLAGVQAIHEAADPAEIRSLWAIRSAGVGLLGKVDGPARPVAFVEDCVVPPQALPAFVADFLEVLARNGLSFGMYGHVDVGCLHIRPALNIDAPQDREKLVEVSDAIFALTRKHGGIFWGEHGKGIRGAYLRDWIGEEAYAALQGVKAAFDPDERYNPGKLVSNRAEIMGIASTPFRAFNAPDADPLLRAFRCNGNAQCLSYAATTPMCPSFKATADLRQSPKGRADALREWHRMRQSGATDPALEADLMQTLDGCLGCKACASSCPVQVDIPSMRTAFYSAYFERHARPLADRLTLLAERYSPQILGSARLLAPFWPLMARIGGWLTDTVDLPGRLSRGVSRELRIGRKELTAGEVPENTVILVQDWFTALFDEDALSDVVAGLRALGYRPRVLDMRPAGKAAQSLGDTAHFLPMAKALVALLEEAASTSAPLVGLDPALVMQLRQDYPKAGLTPPAVFLPQEFLAAELRAGRRFARTERTAPVLLLSHCTEATALADAGPLWSTVFSAVGVAAQTPSTGCCGMAGLFGHQKRHQSVSRKLFDMSWRDRLTEGSVVAASGFSCRCQSERLAGQKLRHPLGVLGDLLTPAVN
ncbi:MAG: FAD-binding oxidoreductase [Rhizobiaceae bacterium]|nr:FAD-binding oxidoreductase [Rhizobiaceae bacterium]